jgi:glycosyltransferase involved in cell wall biosynthesis
LGVSVRTVVLAWNEASTIERTLRELLEQTVFRSSDSSLCVVTNGSTDETPRIARRVLSELAPGRSTLHNLAFADKPNAWNFAVHGALEPSDYVLFSDADISLTDPRVCEDLIDALESNSTALVACAPIGGARNNETFTIPERVELRGALYAARAASLRDLWIPLGIVHEDAYLARWIMSDGFRLWGRPEAELLEHGHIVFGLDRVGAVTGRSPHERTIAYAINSRLRGLMGDVHTRILEDWLLEVPPEQRRSSIASACELDPWWFLRVVDAAIDRHRPSTNEIGLVASSASRTALLRALAPIVVWRANRLLQPGRSWRAAWDGDGTSQPATDSDVDFWARAAGAE